MSTKAQAEESIASIKVQEHGFSWLFTIVIPLAMCVLLFCGAAWQFFLSHSDAAKYACYAVGFWQGNTALATTFPPSQCAFILHPRFPTVSNGEIAHTLWLNKYPTRIVDFVESQSVNDPLHALPHEYPLLALVFFWLGLVAPLAWYQVAFAGWMALFALLTYFALLRFRSRSAALACVIYLVIGGWVTVLGRFDMVPAAFTLFALLCAVRKQWNWAFAWLALGTMTKFYPAILLAPFLLAQQQDIKKSWFSRKRWTPIALFVGICVLLTGVSLALSVEGTLGPFSYFGIRPTQVESFQATLLWLASLVKLTPLDYQYTFGSLNMTSTLSEGTAIIGLLLLGGGLVLTYWLQWRRKIDLALACLLTLLITMVTGKVFSPQYLIWVAPFVAYVGAMNYKWVLPWTVLSLLTTWIYPYIYYLTNNLMKVPYLPLFFPVVAARNILLCGFIVALLVYYVRRKPALDSASSVLAAGDQRDALVLGR